MKNSTSMENIPQLNADETLRVLPHFAKGFGRRGSWLRSALAALPETSRLMQIGYSFADQALAVGGTFLANVVLARTQTKEEYGMFALSYSVLPFLLGLYYAAILEPFTVYGAGRYRDRFSEYLRFMVQINGLVALLLTLVMLLACLTLHWAAPQYLSRALLGLGATVGVLLSGAFLRRVFYLQRQPALAAQASLIYFVTVAGALWLAAKAQLLNGFSVFVILALGWTAAGLGLGWNLALGRSARSFPDSEPGYWREHWRYSKWVLATAVVIQFTSQGYYWLVAGFLSVKEVGDLRAAYNLVGPVDQIFIALSFVVLPPLASHYASNRMDKLLSLWRRYAIFNVAVMVLFILGVLSMGKPALHALYAGRFDHLAPLLLKLSLYQLVMAIAITIVQALNALERPKLVFYAFASSGSATLLFGIPLVKHFGLPGAVYGMVLSGTTFAIALAIGFVSSLKRKA